MSPSSYINKKIIIKNSENFNINQRLKRNAVIYLPGALYENRFLKSKLQ